MFRETEVQVDDKTITLKQEPIDSIFQFGSQPYVILGISGAGKTTLSLHLIHRYAPECTKVFYVSATDADSFSAENDSINRIPKVFRRTPSYEDLYGIWNDIVEENKAIKAPEEAYERILSKIHGEKGKISAKYIKEKCTELYTEQRQKYIAMGRSQIEAEKSARIDENAMRCSALSTLLVDGIKQNGNKMLTENELLIVDTLISKPPKTLFILDDVTAELESLKANNTKFVKFQGKSYKISQAYDLLITQILTAGRHYNCIIAAFLHDVSVMNKVGQINNIIVFDQSSAQTLNLYRKIPKPFLKTLKPVSDIVFNGGYKYYFIYSRPNENYVCVGKADIVVDDFEFSPVNKALIKAHEEISKMNADDDVDDMAVSGDDDGSDDGDEETDEEDDEESEETENE